jgi:hypothetical protein
VRLTLAGMDAAAWVGTSTSKRMVSVGLLVWWGWANRMVTMLLVGTNRSMSGTAERTAAGVVRLKNGVVVVVVFREVMGAPVGVPVGGPAGWRRQPRRAVASEGEFQRGSESD